MSQIFKTIQSKLTDREQLSSMLGQYQERERQLNQTLNEIQLIQLYELQNQHIVQIQILSRLKKILLSIPNQIEANPRYLKDCNDKYFNFIMNQINMKLNSPPESCRFLFHIVSLRIKLWFNKQEFDDIFNSFLINIDHNKKVIPFVIEFLIELIETFSLDTGSQNESFFSNQIISKTRHQNEGRTTLTRKTNNSFFTDDLINKKSFKATKQLSHSISRKSCFNKENRFQRQFLDYELNKILSFANEMFNRAVVENSRYVQEDHSQEHEEQQQLYHILLPASLIAKDLQLVHKVLTYDFFGDRKCHEDEYFNQKMPLIIPTKYSKYCQFQEFDQWIKSRKDLTKYQYIYFYCNDPKLKLIIVKILGDLLRIHQKFFKKDLLFKTHIESVLSPIKLMLQNLEIRYDNEFEIAIALGQTVSKLLSNSTFPTFLNQSRNDFKRQFIGTLEEFIQKQIFDRDLLDISLVRYFLGFFTQVVQKLSINTCDNYKIRDFKEQVYSAVQRIGQSYQSLLYQNQNCSENTDLADYCEFRDAVDQLNSDYFSSFFSFFKYFNPRQYYKEDYDLGSKCISVCSRIQYNIHLHDRTQKSFGQRRSNDQSTPQLSRRYCLQTFTKLIHLIESEKFSQQDSDQQSDSDRQILNIFKYKLMTIGFFIEKLLNCKVSTLMIFAQQNYIFSFTRSFLTLMFQLVEFKAKKPWNEVFIHEIRNAQSFCLDLAPMVVKLNEENLKNTRNAYYDTKQITNTIESAKKQLLGTNFLTQDQLSQTSKRLKQQCQALTTELNYFQNLLKQSNRAFDVHFEGKQSQEHKNISKGIRASVKNKQFERILEPIYKMYFISIEKLQFHLRKRQQLSAKYKKTNQTSILRFSIDTIDQDLQQDDDECTVIEEQDQNQERIGQSGSFRCCTDIQIHDLNHIMNPITDYVFLSHVNSVQSSQLKLVLQKSFISWYQTQTNHAFQQSKQTALSITKIYSIQSIAQRLTQVYFHTIDTYPNTLARQMKFYLLRITVLLLKMFRTAKFEPQIKREILKCCEPFIWFEFNQIQQDNYQLESNHQQFQEDRLMAERVQAVRNLLETVINVHYFEDKVNIYNQEFGLWFPNQIIHDNAKISELQRQEEYQIYQKMRKTKITSELVDRALDFIVRFPTKLLKDGYYRLIEHQLIELIKEFYFELSQFPLVYMFNLDTACDIEETRAKVNLRKIQVDDSSNSYKKYVMSVNSQTLTNVLRAYGALLPFVDQIIQLSLISSDEKWTTVRNKQLLPFLRQITQFFTNLSQQPELLQLTFRLQNVNDPQLCRDQNPFPWITRHLCSTLIEFLYYFLTELQYSETSFVTHHLSLIENVYSLILTIQAMGINYLNESLNNWVRKLNTIVIFKAIPDGKENKKQGKKTPRPNEPKIIRYNGWEYVKRLYEKSSEQILEELQAYDIKFKFYIEVQQTQSQTQTMRQTSSEFDKTIYQEPESKMKSIINSIRKSGQKLREEENQDSYEEPNRGIYTNDLRQGYQFNQNPSIHTNLCHNDDFIAYDEGLNLNENVNYHTQEFEMEQKQDGNKNLGKIISRNDSPGKQKNIPQFQFGNASKDDSIDIKFEQRVIDGEIQFVRIIPVKSKQNKIGHSLNSTIKRPTKDQFYQSHQSSDHQQFYIRSQEKKQNTQNQIQSQSYRNDSISSQCHQVQTLNENISQTQNQLDQNSSKKSQMNNASYGSQHYYSRQEKNSQNLVEDHKYQYYQSRQVQDDELTVYDVLPSEKNLNGDFSSQTLSIINQQSQRNPQFEHIQENQPRSSFKKQSDQPHQNPDNQTNSNLNNQS